MIHGEKLYTTLFVRYNGKFTRAIVFFEYRKDPVPGCRKHKHGHTFRRIKTTQERRWTYAHKNYVRGKRKGKYLPNSWDDYVISSYYDRGWKRQCKKKKQWQ